MQLSKDILSLSSQEIDCTGKHLFWAARPSTTLLNSIRDFGQTSPVFVQREGNAYTLITGYARVQVLTELHRPIQARQVAAETTLDPGQIYLADNINRIMTDGMRFAALRYFSEKKNSKELIAEILPLLGIKAQSKDAKLLHAWLALPTDWQKRLIAGKLPLALGQTLSRTTDADRESLAPLFETLTWSRSNAVNMLNWLFESSQMHAVSISEMSEQIGLHKALKQGLSPKDCIEKLVTSTKEARFPELSRLQKAFAATARELTIGTRWRVTQPNNFETCAAELSIQINDAVQLEQAVTDIASMATLSQWETLWLMGKKHD